MWRFVLWIVILGYAQADGELDTTNEDTDKYMLADDFMVFTDGREGKVFQMDLHGEQTYILAEDQLNPIAVDYDPESGCVFWTDVDAQAIKKLCRGHPHNQTLATFSQASSLEGLAVDGVAGLIFFTDNGKDSISVMSMDGKIHKTIVPIAKHPRTLRLDPSKRKVYWTDWGLGTIEKANYDGTGREVVVTVAGEPWLNGLALDLISRRLFWTDAKGNRIEGAQMEGGTQRKTIAEYPLTDKVTAINDTTENKPYDPHYYGVAVDDNFLYYTDWKNGSVFRMLKDGSHVAPIGWSNHSSLSDIQIFKSSHYFKGAASKCNVNNGGCSHLCIPLLNNNYVCACPDERRLQDDNKTCSQALQTNGPDLIWLEHDNFFTGFIKGIKGEPSDYLRTKEIKTHSIRSPAWHWTAIDMDYTKNMIYLADKYDRFIVSMALNGSFDMKVIYEGSSPQVNGIAVDWLAGNIYWTDGLYNCIMLAKDEERTEFTKRLISTHLDQPHGIVVHPSKGLLFWSDWGEEDVIEQADLTGENRQVIVDEKLNNPTGLVLDYKENRLFWANSDSIESVRLDGSDRQMHSIYYLNKFVDITLYKNYIFATDESKGGTAQVWFYDREKSDQQGSRLGLMRQPSGIVMYDQSRQPPQPRTEATCKILDCEHLCVSAPDFTALCLCRDGYTLSTIDLHSCIESSTFHGPSYIYSTGDRICALPIHQSLRQPIGDLDANCFFNNTKYQFRALDYNYYSGDIFFSDVQFKVRTIRRSNLYNKNNNSVIVYGVGQVNGLALDWVSSNLYWSDSEVGAIWVSRLDGSYMTPLIEGLHHPHGIAIDMKARKLYWSEHGDNLTHPAIIGRSNLAGEERETFVSSQISRPMGLHVDSKERRLYWVDSEQVEIQYADLDNSGRSKLNWPKDFADKPQLYDITTYQDYIIVSEWSSDNRSGLHIFEKATGKEANSRLLHDKQPRTYDVLAFDHFSQPLIQGAALSSCVLNNGGCEQLCLHTEAAYTCGCVQGMQLQPDQHTCQPVSLLHDNFFLMVDDYTHRIYQFRDHDLSDLSAVKFPPEDRPIAVEFDFREERMYWSDFSGGLIKRSFLNGSNVEVIKQKVSGSRIDGLAYEPGSRLLYYTDTGRHLIGVLSTTGAYHKLLVINQLRSPRAIALDPENGYMYYATRESRKGTIQRRNLDGTQPTILLNSSSQLSWPSGIFLDRNKKQLYWVDAHHEKIETATIEGLNRQIIYKTDEDADPFGVVVQGGHIFWTDWNLRGLFRMSENGSDPQSMKAGLLSGLNDIKFFNKSALPGPNACSMNNGGCSHLCLALPGQQRVCACPDDANGPTHTKDGYNCDGVETCLTKIANGELSSDCHARPGLSCSFTCRAGFGKTTTDMIRCMRGNEWNRDINSLCNDQTCPLLVTPDNARVDEDCPRLAAAPVICHHRCNDGFTRVKGHQMRMCTPAGWSGVNLECEAVSCPSLPMPENSMSVLMTEETCEVYARQPVGKRCTYRCAPGYRRAWGSVQRTCRKDLSWSGEELMCEAVSEDSINHDGDSSNPQENIDSHKSSAGSSSLTWYVIGGLVLFIFILIGFGALYCIYRRKGGRFPVTLCICCGMRKDDEKPVVDDDHNNPKLAAYDVRTDSIDFHSISSNAAEFENPGYCSLAGAHGKENEKEDKPCVSATGSNKQVKESHI